MLTECLYSNLKVTSFQELGKLCITVQYRIKETLNTSSKKVIFMKFPLNLLLNTINEQCP